MKSKGFTYIELFVAMTVLAILASATFATTQKLVKRQKEMELRRALLEIREAIDRFKRMSEAGEIDAGDIEQLGYPEDFEQLLEGVPLKKKPEVTVRFLRRIPVDPMTGEAEWGKRSVQDDHDDSSWGGENLFDVYSESSGTAMDGTEYNTW